MNLHPKVAAAGSAGALVTVLVWVLALFHVDMPPEVAAALVAVGASAAGWFKTGPVNDETGAADAITLLVAVVIIVILLRVLHLI